MYRFIVGIVNRFSAFLVEELEVLAERILYSELETKNLVNKESILTSTRTISKTGRSAKDYRLISLLSLVSLIPMIIFFFVISIVVQESYQDFRARQLGAASHVFNQHLQQFHLRSLNLLNVFSALNEFHEEDFCECFLANASEIDAWNIMTASGTIDFPLSARWALGSPGEYLYGIYPIQNMNSEELFLVEKIDFGFWDQLSMTLPIDFIIYHPLTLNVIDTSFQREDAQSRLSAIRSENQPQVTSSWSQVRTPLYLSSPINPTIGDPIQVLFISGSPDLELFYLRITRVAFILTLALMACILIQMKLIDIFIFSKLRTITKTLVSFETSLELGEAFPQEVEGFSSSDDITRLYQEFIATSVRLKANILKKQETIEALQKHQLITEKSHQTFLGYLGQEIRSPIHSMKGLTGLLIEENPNKEFQEVLTILNQEIHRVSEIVTLLLDVNSYEITGGSNLLQGFTIPEIFSHLQNSLSENNSLKNREVRFTSSIHPKLNFLGPKRILLKVLERVLTFFTTRHGFQSLFLSCSLDSSKEQLGTSLVLFSFQGISTDSISIHNLNPELLFIRYLLLPLLGEISLQTSSLDVDSQQQVNLRIRLPLKIDGTGSQRANILNSTTKDLAAETKVSQVLGSIRFPNRTRNPEPLQIPKQLYIDLLSQDSAILSQAMFILRILSSEQEHVKLEQLVLLADSHLHTNGMNREFFQLRNQFIDYLRPYTDISKE